jgi:hypothetical protein
MWPEVLVTPTAQNMKRVFITFETAMTPTKRPGQHGHFVITVLPSNQATQKNGFNAFQHHEKHGTLFSDPNKRSDSPPNID